MSVSYSVMEKGNVGLNIYSLSGRKVKIMVNEMKSAGTYAVPWDGKDDNGHLLQSVVYIYELVCGKNRISDN